MCFKLHPSVYTPTHPSLFRSIHPPFNVSCARSPNLEIASLSIKRVRAKSEAKNKKHNERQRGRDGDIHTAESLREGDISMSDATRALSAGQRLLRSQPGKRGAAAAANASMPLLCPRQSLRAFSDVPSPFPSRCNGQHSDTICSSALGSAEYQSVT